MADRSQHMHTSTGAKYYPFDPRPEEVNIEFIAHHLANQCRWNGATQHPTKRELVFFSVAEHSVLVSLYVERDLKRPDLALEALLHDAAEAPLGDIIRPVKYSPGVKEVYGVLEERNENVIAKAFNLVHPWPKEIKIADEAVCTAEKRQIIPMNPGEDWDTDSMLDESREASYPIQMLLPYQAKQLFLGQFRRLAKLRARTTRPLPDRFAATFA